MEGLEGPEDDRQLVERAARGDREAFGVLVERHQHRAFNLAYRLVRNREDALDVAQEAFARAYASLGSFKGQASFTTWLHRIVVNQAIDWLRRGRRTEAAYDDQRPAPEDAAADPAAPDDPASLLQHKQVQALLAEGLDRLPPAHRAVLVLREVEGMSYDEIGRAVGCSLGTVMSRLFYARRKLRQALEGRLEELR
ncbi:MAG: sigma-70 family RNA polymerase sigma factor [Candidatus Methylomirabilales bacterium]